MRPRTGPHAPARRWRLPPRGTATVVNIVAFLVLLGAGAGIFVHHDRAVGVAAQRAAQQHASATADDLGRTFTTWRTELLVAAADPVVKDWYRRPGDRPALRAEVEHNLLTLHEVDPELFDEACLINADGREQARQVKGIVTPPADLSPDESVNPFFDPTLELPSGHVHRNAPYISPDSNRWVVSNSTPLKVRDRTVGIVHFEANLERIRAQVASFSARDRVVQVVDPASDLVIADSRDPAPIRNSPLPKTQDRVLPAGWELASAELPPAPGSDLDWRIDVVVAPQSPWDAGLLLRLAGLLLLGAAALTLMRLYSGIQRVESGGATY